MPTKSKIQDKTFLFTGTLTELTCDEAEKLVEVSGGKVLYGIGSGSIWWNSIERNEANAWDRSLFYSFGNLYRGYVYKTGGFSVNCLRN